MWTDSVVVAASVATTGHAPRLHCMLDVVSSEPVSRGAKRDPVCFEQKRCAHCARGAKACRKAPGGRDCRVLLLLFGGSWNELLSTRNPSVPGFHPIRSHGGQYWEPLNEFYRSPFRMKNKCFAFLFFFSFLFCSFFRVNVLVSERGDSVSNQMLGHATPTDLAV